ncbi:MAG TPA: beta-N-acetylhexosaminidase, partial [Candidatus Baltobacteraceae bacterium]|nr:beta-N-acetylhexosaminidase [Candidatus Baltobacteraceae bacterium]
MLCTGFPGDTPDAEVLEALAELAPAGVVLFSRNVSTPEGTRRLVAAIRNAVGESTFVAVDQEGGRVARLRAGFTPLPSAMAVGACGDPELAERLGAAIACDLRRIEADVNFAPVLDLALEPANTVIGTRSFGDDAQRVAALGAAVVRGLEGEGVAATLKHFPGLGASARDPHRELPRIDVALATLRARELVPFQAGFAAGARAAMSAHALVPAFDRAQPATLSARILGDVLRGELGFEGAVFTDALEMQAIAGGAGSARGAVLAVAAGADCVLFGEGPAAAQAARDALVDALERGELSDARLRDAAARVARLRSRVKAGGERDAPDGEISRATAQRAIAALRGSDRLERAHPVTVVSFEGGSFDGAGEPAGAQASLSLALRRRNLRSELMRVPLEP